MLVAGEILSWINGGEFLKNVFAQHVDWDAALDARDAPDFDTAWTSIYEEISAACPSESSIVRDIRESAFKKAYAITKSADLAAYVSDDMGLIALAADNQLNIEFVDELWKTYAQGSFPGAVLQG